jgi:hypothetical protein
MEGEKEVLEEEGDGMQKGRRKGRMTKQWHDAKPLLYTLPSSLLTPSSPSSHHSIQSPHPISLFPFLRLFMFFPPCLLASFLLSSWLRSSFHLSPLNVRNYGTLRFVLSLRFSPLFLSL